MNQYDQVDACHGLQYHYWVLVAACNFRDKTALLVSEINCISQFVAGTQPVNALAFVLDGLYYGVSDYEYAAYSMVLTIQSN